MSDLIQHSGGCACGAVRFIVRGEPDRFGLCHCMTCRKAHGAAFNPFVVFRAEQVEVTGAVKPWASSATFTRWFCPECGSRVFGDGDGEYELNVGSFDETGLFTPQYEAWIGRREPWQPALDAPQHAGNRTGDGAG